MNKTIFIVCRYFFLAKTSMQHESMKLSLALYDGWHVHLHESLVNICQVSPCLQWQWSLLYHPRNFSCVFIDSVDNVESNCWILNLLFISWYHYSNSSSYEYVCILYSIMMYQDKTAVWFIKRQTYHKCE